LFPRSTITLLHLHSSRFLPYGDRITYLVVLAIRRRQQATAALAKRRQATSTGGKNPQLTQKVGEAEKIDRHDREASRRAAAAVDWSEPMADKAEAVVDAIDAAEAQGDTERAATLRETLNTASVSKAHRLATGAGEKPPWHLPMPYLGLRGIVTHASGTGKFGAGINRRFCRFLRNRSARFALFFLRLLRYEWFELEREFLAGIYQVCQLWRSCPRLVSFACALVLLRFFREQPFKLQRQLSMLKRRQVSPVELVAYGEAGAALGERRTPGPIGPHGE